MPLFIHRFKMEGHHTLGRVPWVALKQILQPSRLIMMHNMAVLEDMAHMGLINRSLMASEVSKQWLNQQMNLINKHLKWRPCPAIIKSKECTHLEILLDIKDRVLQTQVSKSFLHSN